MNDTIKELLKLTKCELDIFNHVVTLDIWFTSEQLSEAVSLDRSTVQRCLKKLYEEGVLLLTQENLKTGGYVLRYSPKSNNQIRRLLVHAADKKYMERLKLIDKWGRK